jgi:hypothetical protein
VLNFCRQEEVNASRRDGLGLRLSFPASRLVRPANRHRQLQSESSGCATFHHCHPPESGRSLLVYANSHWPMGRLARDLNAYVNRQAFDEGWYGNRNKSSLFKSKHEGSRVGGELLSARRAALGSRNYRALEPAQRGPSSHKIAPPSA